MYLTIKRNQAVELKEIRQQSQKYACLSLQRISLQPPQLFLSLKLLFVGKAVSYVQFDGFKYLLYTHSS